MLAHQVRTLSLDDIQYALLNVPRRNVLVCLLLTIGSFSVLGFYDILATWLVAPGRVPFALAWFAGAVGNAVANTLGFHAVTGMAVRLRVYRLSCLSLGDIARVMSLSWATQGLGFLAVIAVALLLAAKSAPWERPAGAGLIVTLAALLVWLWPGNRRLCLAGHALMLPDTGTAAIQIILSAMEMAAAIGALYILLPESIAVSFLTFSAAYMGAVLLGIISHAPGGIGVFEAMMLSLVGAHDPAGLLAALLLYRLLYNFLPFILAITALAIFEMTNRNVSWREDSGG